MSTQSRRSTSARQNSMPIVTPHRHPFLSAATFTFLASWRGQLLICTVLIGLGTIYVIISRPIQAWVQRRREELSRQRQAELMSSEQTPEVDEKKEVVKERGRDKKKDTKKRKGSLLKVPGGTGVGNGNGTDSSTSFAGPSSIESSPAPSRSPLPSTHSSRTPRKPTFQSSTSSSNSPNKPNLQLHPLPPSQPIANAELSAISEKDDIVNDAEHSLSSEQNVQPEQAPLAPALQLSAEAEAEAHYTIDLHSPSPYTIALPPSPSPSPSPCPSPAGPSRVALSLTESDQDSISDSAPSTSGSNKQSASTGFSIIPEDGYLPAHLSIPSSSKKKKRKNKIPAPLTEIDRRASPVEISRFTEVKSTNSISTAGDKPIPPETPRRHSRKASLSVRPANANAEELGVLLDERDRTIDVLRAEIGVAKAEEAKARESASLIKRNEDKMRSDLDRALRTSKKAEQESHRRESELATRFNQLGSAYTSTLQRLNALESILREGGIAVPPPASPGLVQLGQQPFLSNSPMHPHSPYGVPFHSPIPGSAPGSALQRPYLPYPSPGMYPSPMLHPLHHGPHSHSHSHSHSPSPFRRTSTSETGSDLLAGPLTPGLPSVPSPYPMEMGANGMNGSLPIAPRNGVPSTPGSVPINGTPNRGQSSGTGMTPEQRRQTIESSVLKKKIARDLNSEIGPNTEGDPESVVSKTGSASPEQGENTSADGLEGLGMGEIGPSTSFEHGKGESDYHGQTERYNGDAVESLSVTLSPPDLSHSGIDTQSRHSSSSPSPKPRIITPAELDSMQRQARVHTPDSVGRIIFNGSMNGSVHEGSDHGQDTSEHSSQGMNGEGAKGIRMMVDPQGEGTIYFREGNDSPTPPDFKSHFGSLGLGHPHNQRYDPRHTGENGNPVNGGHDPEDDRTKEYVPVFASLAHTPEQVDEIRRMSMAIGGKRERGLSLNSAGARGV